MAKIDCDRRYRAKHREHVRAYARAWYSKNKENQKLYRLRPDVRAKDKAYRTSNTKLRLVGIKRGARNRGLSYELPEQLALDLITDNCFYCGQLPTPLNGIDRVDNTLGYMHNNVVTACPQCNSAKGKLSKVAFETWVLRAAEHLGKVNTKAA